MTLRADDKRDDPAPELKVARLVRTTNRGFGQCLQTSLSRYGFSSGMWHFLRVLNDEDGITQRELSQRAQTVEPNALKLLERMERMGLIRRQRDEADRRKMRVHLTETGRERYAELMAPAAEIPRAALTGIAPKDVERLADLLIQIQSNLDDYYVHLSSEAGLRN